MKPVILLPDALHINERNFASFHQWVTNNKVATHVVTERADWISLYGEYEGKFDVLQPKMELLALIDPDKLFNFNFHGINLFSVARGEILTRVIARKAWHRQAYPESARGVFDKLYAEYRAVLVQNLAAAMDWIEFWVTRIPKLSPQPTHCCLFSGSLIYVRTLTEVLRMTATRVFVMESFFTGNDYYLEEKYEPVPNNSDLKFPAVYDAIEVPTDAGDYDRERIKAINKVLLGKNKNVQQPTVSRAPEFASERPLVAVLGQVVNDFSVMNYRQRGLSTVWFYRELIEKLVLGGCNVVFKDHPWELKKTHVKRAFTKMMLQEWLANQSEEFNSHVIIDTEFDILKLFKQCDFAVGLNTQSLIEAAFEGLKPVQFGDAFYGGKGFTHDYDLTQVDAFVNDLKTGIVRGTLTLDEVDIFEHFLLKAFQGHLVSVNPSGVAAVQARLIRPAPIALATRTKSTSPAPTIAASTSAAAAVSSPVKSAPAASSLAKPTSVQPVATTAKPSATKPAGTAGTSLATTLPVALDTPELLAALDDPKKARGTKFERKLQKLLTSPIAFILDARLIKYLRSRTRAVFSSAQG